MFTKVFDLFLFALVTTSVRSFTLTTPQNVQTQQRQGAMMSSADDNEEVQTTSRRDFFALTASSTLAASTIMMNPTTAVAAAADYSNAKVLVLGGSGFVGTEVCKQLKSLGVDYVATSRDGRGGTTALDFTNTSVNIASQVEELAKGFGCTAVISCIGSIGTSDDEVVNSGTGLAAVGAKAAGVKNFVYISVAPEVRGVAKGVSFLEKYMAGKQFSEDTIVGSNFDAYTLIEPTFIYGGDKFAINPPRVADGYGKLVEGVLSSSPLRFAASVTPGIIQVALEPPVKVSAVAGAAVSGSLGLAQTTLDTYDKINAASKLI